MESHERHYVGPVAERSASITAMLPKRRLPTREVFCVSRLILCSVALIATLLIGGCSVGEKAVGKKVEPPLPPPAKSQPSTVSSSKAAPNVVNQAAAAALGIKPEQVLNSASFEGGTIGGRTFRGGQVLLWESDRGYFIAQASLDLGDGQWRAANSTAQILGRGNTGFEAMVALLNDQVEEERKVPLWAFFGRVSDPGVKTIEVRILGVPTMLVEVRNGTWLALYQGVIDRPAGDQAEVVGFNVNRRELLRENVKLP